MRADSAADDYHARIDRLVEYVGSHGKRPLSLDHLATVAGFPAPHLRRVFFAMTGEPLDAFVARTRTGSASTAARLSPLREPDRLREIARERGWAVEIVDLPKADVVSITVGNARSHGAELLGLYAELLEWLTDNGVDEERVGLIGMSHDAPDLSADEHPGFEWAASPVPTGG